MTLRKSFLASMKENNKRRIWVWVVSALLWFFYFPVGMALVISRINNRNISMEVPEELALINIKNGVNSWIGLEKGMMILICFLAILCAIQGFSYLYSQKKVDMYHSVPVSKSRRFAIIFINGILIYLVPYLINMFLAMIVAYTNGGMNSRNLQEAFIAAFSNLILYIGIYGLSIIAVMMTGNIIITLFATTVFLIYELAIKYILQAYQSHFYSFFSYNSTNSSIYSSPFNWYGNAIEKMQNISNPGLDMIQAGLPDILKCILLAVIFGVISYICYNKRPSEAAGKPMAFSKTKGIIKILLTVPMTLLIVLEVIEIVQPFNDHARQQLPLIIFVMIIIVILCSCMIEVIYELDIRAVFKKKYHILISSACVFLIFSIFHYDLTGYDKWVPDPDKLESAVILPNGLSNRSSTYDFNLKHISKIELIEKQPKITDIDAICELSEKKGFVEEGDVVGLEVAYQMKNGKTIWRVFPVSAKEETTLNKIFENEAFKKENYSIYNDDMFDTFKSIPKSQITYSTGARIENIPLEDLDTIRKHYIEDLNQSNYSTLKSEIICGMFNFSVEWRDGGNYNYFDVSYDIYPSYKNTIDYLKEKGLYTEKVLYPEEILSITVNNHHMEHQQSADIYENTTVTKVFTDEKQIEELADALYPSSFDSSFLGQDVLSDNYYVTIQLRNGTVTSSHYRGDNGFSLISEKIPDWLDKETAYE